MKIEDLETKEIIKRILQNRIDKTDLSKSQIKEVLFQAREMSNKGYSFINEILLLNPNQEANKLISGSSEIQNSIFLFDFLKETPETEVPKAETTKTKTEQTSYQWQGNSDEELPELYTLMQDKYKLIAPETTIGQFKDIFTGQDIETIIPIEWKVQKNLCAYFIECLYRHNKLSLDVDFNKWSIGKKCFKNMDNLRQMADQYFSWTKTKKPRNHLLIDKLFN